MSQINNKSPAVRQNAKTSSQPPKPSRRSRQGTPRRTQTSQLVESGSTNRSAATDFTRKQTKPKRGDIPYKAWKTGSCARGTESRFGHDPEAQRHRDAFSLVKQIEDLAREQSRIKERERAEQREIARVREEERLHEEERRREEARLRREQARIADEERIREALRVREAARQARLAEQEALRKARDAEYLTRMADISQDEATRTTQHFILGSLVTFGAGLDVRHLITGFECCTVQIKNLPIDASEAEIANIFLDQGLETCQFHILENKVTPDDRRTAKVVMDAEHGEVIAIGLEDLEFGDETLLFEMGSYNLPGGMGTSIDRETDVLTISWKAASIRFVAEFGDMNTTRRQAWVLNGKSFMGRCVKVEVNTPPPGYVLAHFNPNSIMVSNLNPAVNEDDMRVFTGALWSWTMASSCTWSFVDFGIIGMEEILSEGYG